MKTFVLIDDGCCNLWWELDGDTIINPYNYRYDIGNSCVIETVEAESWDDLDYEKTGLIVPDAKVGWLAPDGTWYPCLGENHDLVAEQIIHKKVRDLEDVGYVRIRSSSPTDWLFIGGRLTKEQYNFLESGGWSLEEYKHERLLPADMRLITPGRIMKGYR